MLSMVTAIFGTLCTLIKKKVQLDWKGTQKAHAYIENPQPLKAWFPERNHKNA